MPAVASRRRTRSQNRSGTASGARKPGGGSSTRRGATSTKSTRRPGTARQTKRSKNPYAAPRSDTRRGRGERSSGSRRYKKKTPGAAWVSLSCFGVFLLSFIIMFAMLMSTVMSMPEGGTLNGPSLAKIGVFSLLCWAAVIAGVISAIISLCKKGAPQGIAITGLGLNGLPLAWLVLNMVGNFATR